MNWFNQTSVVWADWMWALSWQFAFFVLLVAIACWLLRSASPRLRHALWLLVLIKILIPPSWSMPWSIGHLTTPKTIQHVRQVVGTVAVDAISGGENSTLADTAPSVETVGLSLPLILMLIWLVVATAFLLVVCLRYYRTSRGISQMPMIDEGPIRISMVGAAEKLGIFRVPDLHVSKSFKSPFLMGVIHPRIVLPKSLVEQLTSDELQTIIFHELVHWKRRDTWIGCGQILAQGLLWFHPLIWWSGIQLRNEREQACDDVVVRLTEIQPHRYGDVILKVLTASRYKPAAVGSLVGVFERGAKLQQRLEDIMSYNSEKRKFGKISWIILCVFALLFLPMGSGLQANPGANEKTTAPVRSRTPYPQIIRMVPQPGQTDVDPNLSEISVTFDRDMSKGMSWTGGGQYFPPNDKTRNLGWIDDHTCIYPVKLKSGKFYRIGINSSGYQNFQCVDGVPADPSAIYFTTAGASKSIQEKLIVPQIVEMDPPNHQQDVDPDTRKLKITFNVPMGGGYSWTGGGVSYPQLTGDQPQWSNGNKTCTLLVKLEPNHQYRLGLNSRSFSNFQSRYGVPLAPVIYEFKTGDK